MLRWCCLVTGVAVSYYALTINSSAILSAPFSPSRYPKVQDTQTNKPLCYMQVSDGTVLDLQKLCSKNPSTKNSLGSRITKSQFRRGTGNAYTTDSQ